MASIKKDAKTGTYYFVLDLPRDPVTDERRQKKRRGFKTKKEAQAAAASLLHELTKGTHIEEKNITFEEFGKVWLEDYKQLRGVKISSVRLRSFQLKNLLTYFAKIPIKNITKKMYQQAIIDLKKSGKMDNSISGIHNAGRQLFKLALEQEIIKSDPTQFTRLPRTATTVDDLENRVDIPKYLEKGELLLFLETAKEKGLDGDYETFLTLAYTGMRIGEFIVLRDTDIDFEENTISITKTWFNETGITTKYILLPPKTKKSTREIEVDPLVTTTLRDYIFKNKEYKMLHRKNYYDKGYVMPNKSQDPGYPRHLKTYESRMRRLLKLAGLNDSLTPHSLRHTHTSLMSEAGADLTEIMDRLGHQNDTTTKLVYLHVTKTRKKDASEKFGAFMRNL